MISRMSNTCLTDYRRNYLPCAMFPHSYHVDFQS
uniref:Uncharacterized protein n=1 Tax=Rhizophora mucronata TaxID=61149 RepID=A0A2P2K3U8_RHIMU